MSVVLQLDDRKVDLVRGEVRVRGEVLPLTLRENSLLHYLYQHRGRVISRDELHREVWGHTVSLNTRAADFAIRRLRSKIEDDPSQPVHLRTQYGEGYVFTLAERLPTREPRSDIVGRSLELEQLRDTYAEGAQIITILGTGGLGKTTLAKHYGERVSQRPSVFCDLSGAVDLDSVLQTLATALQLPLREHGGSEGRIDGLMQSLGPILLILDNVEQVIEATTQVLRRGRDGLVRFLVTSRMRLPVGSVLMLRPLSSDDGQALFLKRLALLRGSAAITPAMRTEARALVEDLDGLPLAIELAAARGRLFTPAALRRRLSNRLSLLQDGVSRSLRSTIDWSWSLLTPAQQRAFAQCSVFRGPFSVDMALAVIMVDDDPLRVLEQLCDQSMIQTWTDIQEPYMRLFETLRVYASEKLDALGERQRTERRYCECVLAHAQTLLHALHETESREAMDAIHRYSPDIHQAHALILRHDPAKGPEFLELIRLILGPSRATRARVQQTLDALPVSSTPRPRMEALYWAAELDWNDPDLDSGIQLRQIEALQQKAIALEDECFLARVHQLLSATRWRRSDFEGARTHLLMASTLLERQNAVAAQSRVECLLAVLHTTCGQPVEAEAAVRKARYLAPDNERSQLFVHAILGMLRVRQGAPTSGRSHLEQALERAPRVADQSAVGLALTNIGVRFGRLGELQRATDLIMQGLEKQSQLGLLHACAEPCLLLAKILVLQGDLDGAREYLEQYLRIEDRTPLSPTLALDGEWIGGVIEALQQRPVNALERFRKCIRMSRQAGVPLREGFAWIGCLLTPAEPVIHAQARSQLEALQPDHPLLHRGLQVVEGDLTITEPPFGPSMPLLLLQLMRQA